MGVIQFLWHLYKSCNSTETALRQVLADRMLEMIKEDMKLSLFYCCRHLLRSFSFFTVGFIPGLLASFLSIFLERKDRYVLSSRSTMSISQCVFWPHFITKATSTPVAKCHVHSSYSQSNNNPSN